MICHLSLATVPLTRLLYHTHDSGTSAINPLSMIAPKQDVPDWLNYLRRVPVAGFVTNAVIAGWAKSQHLTILEQLIAGIRYLDLRVVRSGSDYYICHGMYSFNFDDVVADVQKFVAEFPKEIIIFDIHLLYNMDEDAEQMGLISKLFKAFGDKMAPNSHDAKTSLSTFQGSGYQIIALYACESVVNNPTLNQGGRLWSQNQIQDVWANKNSLGELVPELGKSIKERKNDRKHNLEAVVTPNTPRIANSAYKLYNFGAVVTPDTSVIVSSFMPYVNNPKSLLELGTVVLPTICNCISEWNENCIVTVDYFDYLGSTFVDTVVNQNLHSVR